MKQILLISALMLMYLSVQGQDRVIHEVAGRVTTMEEKEGLAGATLHIDGKAVGVTDKDGYFNLRLEAGNYQLNIRYLGFTLFEKDLAVPTQDFIEVVMEEDSNDLDAVEVVTTGYQELPKERATGSFVKVDRELVDRRVGTNILDRLEDVTPGLIFNRSGPATDAISIRGRNTLFANTSPLVIIDNFPYDGPLENINPNDVESVTVLKDAAAASIWGARAGNGVIVITTKSGRRNQGMQVSLNSNLTFAERPDAFYQPLMSSGDFVDREISLFGQGYYNFMETSPNRAALTPAVETLIAERDGLISTEEAERQLQRYRQHDVRSDYRDYMYRQSVQKQVALNVSGGGESNRYMISAGYDRNLENLVGNEFSRISINAKNEFSGLKERLRIGTGIYYTQTNRDQGNSGDSQLRFNGYQRMFAYARLADEAGNPLAIPFQYRTPFVDQASSLGLLDWNFYPLKEMGLIENRSGGQDLRLNLSASYEIIPGLRGEVYYQYWTNSSEGRVYYPEESYHTRNLINSYTQVNPNGTLLNAIPRGAILNMSGRNSQSHNLRGQLSYNKTWKNLHAVNAIAGYEIRDFHAVGHASRYYGYDDAIGTNHPVDYVSFFNRFHNPAQLATIPFGNSLSGTTDRFLSYYSNAAYTFKNRYTLSVSARKDESNLFGVDANQRGVPLMSTGLSWVLSDEPFYGIGVMPYLKLRATYGFNGNIDKNVTAFTTARYTGVSPISGLRYATMINPPNPALSWEKIKIVNLALEFESKDGVVSGSLEYFQKDGMDLIGDSPMAPSVGVRTFRGNVASTRSRGVDLILSTRNIDRGVRWNTDFFLSSINEKVVDYEMTAAVANYLSAGDGKDPLALPLPLEGRPLFAVYSYQWAGLDPDNGNPLGYLNGEVSDNYTAIINAATTETINFHGSARPTLFGAVRNSVHYKGFSLSANISYRLGYFYKRNSVRYGEVLSGERSHGDYSQRWQQPGDEMNTSVPSMPSLMNFNRDNFYLNSEVLVERGDNIRLQDIRFGYNLSKSKFPRLPFRNAEIYTYANNLGILWKASDDPLDPDFRTMRPLRSIAAGIRIDF